MNSMLVIPLSCLHLTFFLAVTFNIIAFKDGYRIERLVKFMLSIKIHSATKAEMTFACIIRPIPCIAIEDGEIQIHLSIAFLIQSYVFQFDGQGHYTASFSPVPRRDG